MIFTVAGLIAPFAKAYDKGLNATESLADTVTHSTKSALESVKTWKDRRALESNLLKRKELAREYEQNRVPAGHKYFQDIYAACMDDVRQFCNKHGEDEELTAREYPFLYSLKLKAHPESDDDYHPTVLLKAFGAVTAVAILCFLTGAATSLYQGGHNLVATLFGS